MTDRPALLAVDVGTSNSVAVLRSADGRVRPLLFDGTPLLPSAVYATADAELTVGVDALHLARLDPGRFEPNPKRRVDEGSVLLGEREVPVVELLGAVLRRVADEAIRVVGELPDVVLTYPATWGPVRRAVLQDAATAAGLRVSATVAEPVAAAAYFTAVLGTALPVDAVLGVLDVGAGTADVALVRVGVDGPEVIAVGGLDDAGGLDMDAALVQWLGGVVAAEARGRLSAPADPDQVRDRMQLWWDVRAAKEMLSRTAVAPLRVPGHPAGLHLTRGEFETAVTPLIDRVADAVAGLVREAGLRPAGLAGLFLVGGATRVPLVSTVLHRRLGLAPTVIEQPELAVAEGALYAAPPPRPQGAVPATTTEDLLPEAAIESSPAWAVRRRRLVVAIAAALLVIIALIVPLLDRSGVGSGAAPHRSLSPTTSTGSTKPSATPTTKLSTSPPPGPVGGPTPTSVAVTPTLRAFVQRWDAYPWGTGGCFRYDYRHVPDGAYGQLSPTVGREPEEWIYCQHDAYEVMFGVFRNSDRRDLVWNAYSRTETQTSSTLLPAWSDRWAPQASKYALMWRDPSNPTLGILVTTQSVDELQGTWSRYQS